jgi:uncharacterized membrane protein YqjE
VTVEAPSRTDSSPPRRESIGDLVRRLVDDIANLVRAEIQLARSEVGEGLARARVSLAAVAIGAMLSMVATTCLLVAMIAWLAEKVGLVAAALIVAAIMGAAAAALIGIGITRLQRLDLAPKRTTANLIRTAEMLKGD